MLKKISFVFAVVALSLAVASSAQAYTFNTDLTVGSTGADVIALQDILVGAGHLTMPAGVAKGYFGALTQAAVAKWQAAMGITPSVGYVGPKSRAALNGAVVVTPASGPLCPNGKTLASNCMIAPAGTPTGPLCPNGKTLASNCMSDGSDDNGSLEGTEGSIDDVTSLGQFSNEEVSEGSEDVKVLGAEVEVSSDGDIALRSVKVSFDSAGNTGSDNLDDYLESVSIWLGDEEIGQADVDDFSESSTSVFSKTITVSDAVIKADETAKLYVAVNAAGNIDSSDISGDSWTVDIDAIRFEDGSGVVTTDSASGVGNLGADVPINFVSFSTAADTELKISTASDNPTAGIVVADSSSVTEGISLLKGKLKLEGNSDVVIDSFPVTFTATANGGTANGVDDITGSVTLRLGDEEYTESVTISSALVGTVTFDNLDFSLEGEDSLDFEVTADVEDIDGTVFVAGATLKADVTASNRNLMDVENSEGDQLSDSTEKSGTATGEAQEFRTSGIMLTFVSNTPSPIADNAVANNDLGTFTLKFKITGIGDTVYVSTLADAQLSGNTDGKTTILVDRAGTATVGGVSASIRNISDTTLNSAGLYAIEDGQSETFELTTTVQLPTAGAAGLYHAVLGGVRWTTDSTDATPSNSYTSNLDEFVVTGTLN